MDLHDRHLIAGVVDVFVECDQPWLVGLDELNESRYAPPLSLELPFLSRLVAMKINGEGIPISVFGRVSRRLRRC
jgi:hypothetical protein